VLREHLTSACMRNDKSKSILMFAPLTPCFWCYGRARSHDDLELIVYSVFVSFYLLVSLVNDTFFYLIGELVVALVVWNSVFGIRWLEIQAYI